MTKVQKKFSAEFKAKVALAALQNQMTVAEIIEKFGVSKNDGLQVEGRGEERGEAGSSQRS